jgi:hypothetical protein
MKMMFNTLFLGAALALLGATVTPMRADEWNKETTVEFSAPVEIPGKVLPAGKYVFKIADSESDRNTVEIFSEDTNGRQNLMATILAVPDYRETTPDKPTFQFEERAAGSPEAIHSWFYPGENTGWEFVYPKGEKMSANTMPAESAAAPAPASTTPEPASTPAPTPVSTAVAAPAAKPELVGSVTITEDDVAYISDPQALTPAPAEDAQVFADRTLPETAGHSGLELLTALAMTGGGIAVLFASRLKAQA